MSVGRVNSQLAFDSGRKLFIDDDSSRSDSRLDRVVSKINLLTIDENSVHCYVF
jgi:hypothetical protein